MSTFLLLSAILPIAYLIFAAGTVSRFFNNPGRAQVYTVLRFRWHLLGSGVLLWLAGLAAANANAAPAHFLVEITGGLLIILIPISIIISGCKMYAAVQEAKFLAPNEGKAQLSPDDPVIGLELKGESHAYPIKWIKEPQIVEDIIGGTPVIVTYSANNKNAVAFSADVKLHSLRLIFPPHREENVMLYDTKSKRLIQQDSGEIIFGPNKGGRIPTLNLRIVPWVTWESLHPESKVFYYESTQLPISRVTEILNRAVSFATISFGLNIAASRFPIQHHSI